MSPGISYLPRNPRQIPSLQESASHLHPANLRRTEKKQHDYSSLDRFDPCVRLRWLPHGTRAGLLRRRRPLAHPHYRPDPPPAQGLLATGIPFFAPVENGMPNSMHLRSLLQHPHHFNPLPISHWHRNPSHLPVPLQPIKRHPGQRASHLEPPKAHRDRGALGSIQN